ncbi:MAG: hypothetical protein H0T57_07230 [Rubrobacter sp.]|nr:hypothetical protein [Rubrobacter sp.]
MTNGTYSPSLNTAHWRPKRKVQESAFSEGTSDWNEEFRNINLIASRLAFIPSAWSTVRPSVFSLGTISSAITLPMEAIDNALMLSMGTFGNVVALPLETAGAVLASSAEAVSSMVAPSVDIINSGAISPMTAVSGSLVSVPKDEAALASEVSQVEHRGWGDFVDSTDYEARLDAISPGLANIEAEEHIPPPPRGKIRAIPLR